MSSDRPARFAPFSLITLVFLASFALLAACASTPDGPLFPEQELGMQQRLAHNVWYVRAEQIHSVNHQSGTLLAVGDAVSNIEFEKGRRRSQIHFRHDPTGQDFTIFFLPKYHPGVTREAFFDRLFTVESLEQLTSGMSAMERSEIAKGTTAPGMSRDAVILSQGYPPEHRTPSLNHSTWKYWSNRFASKDVEFGIDGRVK